MAFGKLTKAQAAAICRIYIQQHQRVWLQVPGISFATLRPLARRFQLLESRHRYDGPRVGRYVRLTELGECVARALGQVAPLRGSEMRASEPGAYAPG